MPEELFVGIRAFYSVAILLCAVMVLIWLVRLKSQGNRALVMAGAFVMLGGLFWAIIAEQPTPVLVVFGILLFILLAVDISIRSVQQSQKEDKKA